MGQFKWKAFALSSLMAIGSNAFAKDYSFKEWCNEWNLNKCDLEPSGKLIAKKTWNASMDVALGILESRKTRINLVRQDLDRKEISELIGGLSLGYIFDFFNQMAWDQFNKNPYTIELVNKGGDNLEQANGLIYSVANQVKVERVPKKYLLDVRGVSMGSNASGDKVVLDTLDLSDPQGLKLYFGNGSTVSKIPWSFFSLKANGKRQISIQKLLLNIAEITFAEEFDWADKISLSVGPEILGRLADGLSYSFPSQTEGFINILRGVKKLSIPSPERGKEDIIYLFLGGRGRVKCTIPGVPFGLGKLIFEPITRLTDAVPLKDSLNSVRFSLEGVSVNLVGEIKEIDLNEKQTIVRFENGTEKTIDFDDPDASNAESGKFRCKVND